MNRLNSFSHLTLDERRIILTGITNGSTKAAIALTLGKDKSTIGKEIKKHRVLSYKCALPMECSNYRKCPYGRHCTADCPGYSKFRCTRRDRSPGACNGCSNWRSCRFDKFTYSPEKADAQYHVTLSDSREGVNLTSTEAKAMADIIAPLLKQGHSPYQIITNHPELGICEKTLYNYIEWDIFKEVAGITAFDLRRQLSRKKRKKPKGLKKRIDYKFLKGRTYKDYREYIADNPELSVMQMDTVYNDESNGPFIQTFKLISTGLFLALFHDRKTAQDMLDGINLLEKILGEALFRKHACILLTDRGSEFLYADAIETAADGVRRCRVFYCDPMQSGQKGSLENKHEELRYILPKGTDMRKLGLTGQDKLNIALSHINSAPLEKLGGKSSLELTEFMFPDLYEKLNQFGIQKIEKDKVILKPYLLK